MLGKPAPCEASGADIGKHLGALAFEIGGRLAAFVHPDLAGDEQELRRLDAGDVRIGRDRPAESVGVEKLDIGHEQLPRACEGMERLPETIAMMGYAARSWQAHGNGDSSTCLG